MSKTKAPSDYTAKAIEAWTRNRMAHSGREEQLRVLSYHLNNGEATLRDDLVLLGWAVYCRRYWKTHRRTTPEKTAAQKRQAKAERALQWAWHDREMRESEARHEKAAAFDRIVEALDHLKVGGKLLGDCTKADLLREAVKLEQAAACATVQGQLYRQLAKLVGSGTVRESSKRHKVVALLSNTFKEAA